jgi:DNA-binding NarL/FixJ family response regulator
MNLIKIAILDDHQTLTESLRAILSKEKDIEIVAAEHDWDTFWLKVKNQEVDLVILDINLKRNDTDGIDIAEKFRYDKPTTKRLILSVTAPGRHVKRARELGVDGFLLKDVSIKHLLDVIRGIVYDHQTFFPPVEDNPPFTRKEKEILALVSRGKGVPEIAKILGNEPGTISKHKKNIMTKLDIHNGEALVAWGIKNGYDTYPVD